MIILILIFFLFACSFYNDGGWNYLLIWLNEAVSNKNWPLTNQILEHLLPAPVTVDRLKSNSIPKIVKELSNHYEVPGKFCFFYLFVIFSEIIKLIVHFYSTQSFIFIIESFYFFRYTFTCRKGGFALDGCSERWSWFSRRHKC